MGPTFWYKGNIWKAILVSQEEPDQVISPGQQWDPGKEKKGIKVRLEPIVPRKSFILNNSNVNTFTRWNEPVAPIMMGNNTMSMPSSMRIKKQYDAIIAQPKGTDFLKDNFAQYLSYHYDNSKTIYTSGVWYHNSNAFTPVTYRYSGTQYRGAPIVWNGTYYFAILTGTPLYIQRSSDGITWNNIYSGSTIFLVGANKYNGTLYASIFDMSTNKLCKSTNHGLTWNVTSLPSLLSLLNGGDSEVDAIYDYCCFPAYMGISPYTCGVLDCINETWYSGEGVNDSWSVSKCTAVKSEKGSFVLSHTYDKYNNSIRNSYAFDLDTKVWREIFPLFPPSDYRFLPTLVKRCIYLKGMYYLVCTAKYESYTAACDYIVAVDNIVNPAIIKRECLMGGAVSDIGILNDRLVFRCSGERTYIYIFNPDNEILTMVNVPDVWGLDEVSSPAIRTKGNPGLAQLGPRSRYQYQQDNTTFLIPPEALTF